MDCENLKFWRLSNEKVAERKFMAARDWHFYLPLLDLPTLSSCHFIIQSIWKSATNLLHSEGIVLE